MISQCITNNLLRVAVSILLIAGATLSSQAQENSKATLGWVEKIHIKPWEIEVEAKLDPGAKTSSMQAEKIERFEKDGDEWVKFELEVKDERSNEFEREKVERRIERDAHIKQHGEDNIDRPVVRMKFCLDNQEYEAEFSLTDRDQYNYPVLLGREFLEEVALVDPSETFIGDPECPDDE